MGNELADEEARLYSAEHQPLIALDPTTRRAPIRCVYASTFNTTPLQAASSTRILLQFEDVLLFKPQTTDLRRFRSGHYPTLRRWKNLINRSEETMCHLCDNEEESYDHLWLRCPAFDAGCQRLDLWASLGDIARLRVRSQALLRIIRRRLG